mmetsp:Transcript_5558/g.13919  ORF Transcript_5558/g.13919 Transcript_5558/m.13919 type:complete len:114 (+) Transcript_5558:489-830(+)
MAALAPLCLEAAGEGDQVARDILNTVVEELAESIRTLKDKLFATAGGTGGGNGAGEPAIVLVGGLMSSKNILNESLEAKINAMMPRCAVLYPECEAAQGAAILAQREAIQRQS